MQKQAKVILSLLVPLLSVSTGSTAFAHRLNVFAYPSGSEICVEASFAGGNPAKNADIKIVDEQGKVVLTSKTSKDGKNCAAVPTDFKPVSLTVVVNAGEGHRNQWTIEKSEFDGISTPIPPNSPSPAAIVPQAESKLPKSGVKLFSQPEMDEAIRAAKRDIEVTVIAPLRKQLAEAQLPKTTFKDIIGGIGWLVGIAGLIAWFTSRRKQK